MSAACSLCFLRPQDVVGATTSSQAVALRFFTELHQSGHAPVMCQQEDDSFHICYEAPRGDALGRQRLVCTV